MEFGTHLPRPEWVPFYPGALTVQASKLTSVTAPSGFQGLEIATRASLDDVKRFYTAALTTSGFEVTDHGIAPLNPATAAMLGMAGTLSATRAATDDSIDVQIRTPDGLLASRLLQIRWRKISETPVTPAPPQPSADRSERLTPDSGVDARRQRHRVQRGAVLQVDPSRRALDRRAAGPPACGSGRRPG